MWKNQSLDGTKLGIQKSFLLTEISTLDIPRCTPDYKCYTSENNLRCHFKPTGKRGGGSYGFLEECIRIEPFHTTQTVLIKKSKLNDIDLRTEAFLQWLAATTLESLGYQERIPPVLDIFSCETGSCAFSMKEIQGATLATQYLLNSSTIDLDFQHLLAQVSILLFLLQLTLGIDHRDLKADNLLVLQKPSRLFLDAYGQKYDIYSPFQVCIVDFGFACLGQETSEGSLTILNAGKNVLPDLDPCPKDGRDLFHLLVSLYGIPQVYEKFSTQTLEFIETNLQIGEKQWHKTARRWSHSEWTYLVTTEKNFVHPPCAPLAILDSLKKRNPTLFLS